jgi:arsenate reductase
MNPLKVLYICTHNRCRSILSEAVLNKIAGTCVTARSAGSTPAGAVHPMTLFTLSHRGYDTSALRSRSWHDNYGFDPDLVITVCDSAAKEVCPLQPGDGQRLHWSLPDPSKITDDENLAQSAFHLLIDALEIRAAEIRDVCLAADSKTTAIRHIRNLGQVPVAF